MGRGRKGKEGEERKREGMMGRREGEKERRRRSVVGRGNIMNMNVNENKRYKRRLGQLGSKERRERD